jgi:hypothetical protein
MSAPDQLGSDKLPATLGTSGDKIYYRVKLGRELLPETAVFAWLSGPVRAHACAWLRNGIEASFLFAYCLKRLVWDSFFIKLINTQETKKEKLTQKNSFFRFYFCQFLGSRVVNY